MRQSTTEQKLTTLLSHPVSTMGCELLGCELLSGDKQRLLRLYIDKAGGVGLEDCQRVSEHISPLLDVEGWIQGHYRLEVSSPGVDRPIFNIEQLAQCIGRHVRLKLAIAIDGQRHFKGRLLSFNEELTELCLEMEDRKVAIQVQYIDKANLLADVIPLSKRSKGNG